MPLTFKRSERLSIGTEIELQLVDDKHYDLTDRADRVVSAVATAGASNMSSPNRWWS
ncbi:hypothetical protein ACT4IN_03450 [Serratia marcescens]